MLNCATKVIGTWKYDSAHVRSQKHSINFYSPIPGLLSYIAVQLLWVLSYQSSFTRIGKIKVNENFYEQDARRSRIAHVTDVPSVYSHKENQPFRNRRLPWSSVVVLILCTFCLEKVKWRRNSRRISLRTTFGRFLSKFSCLAAFYCNNQRFITR